MELKSKIPNLSKYVPEVLSVEAIGYNISQVVNTTRERLAMSPEEQEKELYESLRKKYEET
jgi:hypothetical protein